MSESDLPVNALSPEIRRRKFQRRCSVTEHSLRASRHVREMLYREECRCRQQQQQQQFASERHALEHDSVPALVDVASIVDTTTATVSTKKRSRFLDQGKCFRFRESWKNDDKFSSSWNNNSLMALTAPFLLQEEQWGEHVRKFYASEMVRIVNEPKSLQADTDNDGFVPFERCHKKRQVEKPVTGK